MSGLTKVDVGALISSSKELSNSKFNWNNKIDNVDIVTRKLRKISSEHDGCLDPGIKTLVKLSDRLVEMQKEGSIIKNGLTTAIAAFIAAENGYSIHTNYDYNDYNLGLGKVNMGVTETAQSQLSSHNKSKVGGEKYWKLFSNKNIDWCACFVTWCMKNNGVSNNTVKRSPRVKDIYQDSLKQGTFHSTSTKYKPKPGDLIVWQNNRSHIGIVESSKNGKITTIEGNTTPGNINNYDANKSKVLRHTYTSSNSYGGCSGFISPNYQNKK